MKHDGKIALQITTTKWITLLFVFVLLAACQRQESAAPKIASSFQPTPVQTAAPAAPSPSPTPYTTEATLIAVGDVMMHRREIATGFEAQSKSYHFDSFFTKVKPLLTKGDWVTANLETVLADHDPRGYTGYPEFNAPPELADALKNAGFNIITTANNHAMDRREHGVIRSLSNLHARGLITKGTAASKEESERIVKVDKNGISMAFLAYTYGTNGIPVPEGKGYLVNLIVEDRIKKDIAAAKQDGADLVTIALHFGDEYHTGPNDFQKTLARHLIAAGADVILGSHPHVVQPYEFIEESGSEGEKRKGVVIYSLGNFISDQDRYHSPYKPTDTGVIFEVKVKKHFPDGKTEIAGVETLPTYVQRYAAGGRLNFRVLPIAAMLEQRNDPYLKEKDYQRLGGFLKEMNKHLQELAVPADQQPAS